MLSQEQLDSHCCLRYDKFKTWRKMLRAECARHLRDVDDCRDAHVQQLADAESCRCVTQVNA